MIRVCAWCLLLMGFVKPYRDMSVTHGLCDKCQEKVIKEALAAHKQMGVSDED